MTSPWSCVLWDLDGTILDASEGILARLTRTHEHFGRPAPRREDLVHWIGPPLFDSFRAQLGMSEEQAAEAVTFYRGLHADGGAWAGSSLFAGVREILEHLHAAGVPLAIASSKPLPQVTEILAHYDLARFFTAVVGATPDERTLAAKGDIIAEALRRLAAAGVHVDRPVHIGDRHHDVAGGAENDVPVIFVRWGFSWPHEADGAAAVVDTPADLRRLLLTADA